MQANQTPSAMVLLIYRVDLNELLRKVLSMINIALKIL
jgi:hypothetical protein